MAANQRGSGFTNIQRVIGANTANRLGSTIASKVGDVASQTRSQLGQAQTQFQTKAEQEQSRLKQNAQKRDETLQNLGADVPSEEQKNQFKELRSGESKGPSQLDNVFEIRNKTQEAQQIGKNLGSAGGQQALLQKYAGGQQYTQGQQRLDQLLLGQTGGQQLNQAKRAVTGIGGELERAETGASARSQGLINQAQQLKSDTLNKLGQGFSGIEASAEQQAAAENQKRLTEVASIEAIKAKLQQARDAKDSGVLFGLDAVNPPTGDISADATPRPSYKLTPDELKALGLTNDTNFYAEGADLTGVENSLQDTESLKALANVKGQQALDEQQRNKYYALQDLAGGDVSGKYGLNRNQAYQGMTNFDAVNEESALTALGAGEDKINKEKAELERIKKIAPDQYIQGLQNLLGHRSVYGDDTSFGTFREGSDINQDIPEFSGPAGGGAADLSKTGYADAVNSLSNGTNAPDSYLTKLYNAAKQSLGDTPEAKKLAATTFASLQARGRADPLTGNATQGEQQTFDEQRMNLYLNQFDDLKKQLAGPRFRRVSNLFGGQS